MFLPDFIKKFILILLLIYSFSSIFNTFSSIHNNVLKKDAEYKEKILGLKVEKENLESKLAMINSDEFVEKEARTRLNMKKENEEIYLISSNEPQIKEEVSYIETSPKMKKEESNFDKWMELLF